MDLAMEDYRRVLWRIVVMLLALAGLAERAAGRSRPLRGVVMRLLCPAEAVAREFVVEASLVSGALSPPLPPTHEIDDSPASAIRLALRLRALAMVLCWLAARRGRWTCSDDEISSRFHSRRAALRQCRISTSSPQNFPPFTRQRIRPGAPRDRTRAPPPSMPGAWSGSRRCPRPGEWGRMRPVSRQRHAKKQGIQAP